MRRYLHKNEPPVGRIALSALAQDGALHFDLALTEKDCEFLKHCGIAVQG